MTNEHGEPIQNPDQQADIDQRTEGREPAAIDENGGGAGDTSDAQTDGSSGDGADDLDGKSDEELREAATVVGVEVGPDPNRDELIAAIRTARKAHETPPA